MTDKPSITIEFGSDELNGKCQEALWALLFEQQTDIRSMVEDILTPEQKFEIATGLACFTARFFSIYYDDKQPLVYHMQMIDELYDEFKQDQAA